MISCFPTSLWKLDKKDFILFAFSFFINSLIILSINPNILRNSKNYKSYKFLAYQDSIISLHSAQNLFKENKENLSPASSFCNPLQTHAIFIRFFIYLFSHLFLFLNKGDAIKNNLLLKQIKVKSVIYGQITSIFIASFIVCYVFRRLISIFHICDYKTQKNGVQLNNIISTNPFIITIISTVLPFRFAFLRSCPTSDSLFFAFICFSLIFFNVSSLLSTFLFEIAFVAALTTRYEGVILIPIFLIIIIYKLFIFAINKIKNKPVKNEEEINKKVKIDEKDDNSNENIILDSNMEDDLYDENSSKFLISLILKLIFVIISSIIYYFYLKNYNEIPFTFKDFLLHLIFPYQFPDEKSDKGKTDKENLISYPFSLLLKNAGTISTLRQAHSVFSLLFPLLFSGFLLITTKSSEYEDSKPNFKAGQIKKQEETQQKPKPIVKEEKNQPRMRQKVKSNTNKFKNNRNANKSNFNSDENQTQEKNQIENESQNQEIPKTFLYKTFSTSYQKVTADFLRQIGIFVLTFAILASCMSTSAVFRIVVVAQSIAYPIVAERLIKNFLQLLFSTSNYINSQKKDGNDNDEEMKKLKIVAVSEKVVFIGGSLIFLAAIVAWDCFYSRRESHRYTFASSSWYSLAIN